MPENVISMFLSVQVTVQKYGRESTADKSGLKVIYEPDREKSAGASEGYVQDGDTILVKASHFTEV